MRGARLKNPEKIKRQILEYFDQLEDREFNYKLQSMLLLINDDNANCSDVARIYGTTPQTVARWVHRINQSKEGIGSLRTKSKPGRKTRLSANDMNHIKDVLKQGPKEYDIRSNNWDGITLSTYLKKEMGIEIKTRQCQRILKKIGAANKSGRPWDKVAE